MADDEGEGGGDGVASGTYLVRAVDDATAVLRDVETAQVVTLADETDLSAGEIVQATVTAAGPLDVAWELDTLEDRWTIPVERSPEAPTTQARAIADEQDVGAVTRRERAGEGELHVLTVPEGETDSAAADVLEDEETVTRAARLGVGRVEVRAADGVVSVRYLP